MIEELIVPFICAWSIIAMLLWGCDTRDHERIVVGYPAFIEGVEKVYKDCDARHKGFLIDRKEQTLTLDYYVTRAQWQCVVATYEKAASQHDDAT